MAVMRFNCVIDFLSRLCGGEGLSAAKLRRQDFLSRLCGGEGFSRADDVARQFLSRLCGGEVDTG